MAGIIMAPMRCAIAVALLLTAGCKGGNLCENLKVDVVDVKAEPPVPLHLPQGGTRISFDITNNNDTDVDLPASTDAQVVVDDKRALSTKRTATPGDWFMPVTIPAGTKKTLWLIVDPNVKRGDLQELRANNVRKSGSPTPACSLLAPLR